MDYLVVCNNGSDDLSKINMNSLKEDMKISLNNASGRIGPHGICTWKSHVITANSFSSSISIVDIVGEENSEDYYIGGHCNDIAVYKNEAYITCGEGNNIVVFDLETKKIMESIPGGNLPHSIEVNNKLGIAAVSNMESDSITLIDCKKREIIKEVAVKTFPTKAVFAKDDKHILVCESYLGSDTDGSISIISLDTLSVEGRINVGRNPIDICCDESMCYVSNFNDGYVSFIYTEDLEVVKKIYLGGMPRGVVKKGRYLYVADNYGSLVTRYDIYKESKNIINVGKEPMNMIIV